MPYILQNEHLEVHIDHPLENYQESRFDWTGKIRTVKFRGLLVSGLEKPAGAEDPRDGRGFYNEFGIDQAVGFEETEIGGWFHKIGVGLLKKEDHEYHFHKSYETRPADFQVLEKPGSLLINCKSASVNGFAYRLEKEISLLEDGFGVQYALHNSGSQALQTNEYNHNFIAINQEPIGRHYVLKFPFAIKPDLLGETVNPEGKVRFDRDAITFSGSPTEPFFFSNLSGGRELTGWELQHTQLKIGIREMVDFPSQALNLWGWGHVVSPEIFFKLLVLPGQTMRWKRTWQIQALV
jgi:hypothetical protein